MVFELTEFNEDIKYYIFPSDDDDDNKIHKKIILNYINKGITKLISTELRMVGRGAEGTVYCSTGIPITTILKPYCAKISNIYESDLKYIDSNVLLDSEESINSFTEVQSIQMMKSIEQHQPFAENQPIYYGFIIFDIT